MRKIQLAAWVILVALAGGWPADCAAQSARAIPKGTLSISENGMAAGEFQSEVPVPRGASLACSGDCLVQGEKFQLIARDKTRFSLAQDGNEWVLTVTSGTVEFSMSKDAKLAFVTPNDKYKVKKAITVNGLAKGRVNVTPAGAEFTTSSGEIHLASADGVRTILPGADTGGAAAMPSWVLGGSGAPVTGLVAGVVATAQNNKSSTSPF